MSEPTRTDGQVQVTPGTLPKIPKAYLDLGAVAGFHPLGADDLNMIISAEGGSGKTTFAAGIPNALLIDADAGAHSVLGKEAVDIPLRGSNGGSKAGKVGYDLYAAIITQLVKDSEKGNRSFHTVIFDSADTWSEMIADWLVSVVNERRKGKGRMIDHIGEYGDGGAGYQMLYHRLMYDLNLVSHAGYRWVVLCHLREKEIKVGRETKTVIRPAVGKGFYDLVRRRADVELSMKCEVTAKTVRNDRGKITGQALKRTFVVQVEPDETRQAKRRLYNVSGEFRPDLIGGYKMWANYYDEKVAEAVAEEKKRTG